MITCTFEDGGTGKLRHVTINAIVTQGNKILLGKRGTYMHGKPLLEAGKWAMLGGFLGRDESLEQALKREVQEESGWIIDNLKLFHVKDNPDRPAEDRQNIEFVFVANAVEKVSESDEEVTNLEWFSVDELPAKEMIAFDHGDDLELYKKYVKKTFSLPVIGKI
jgi:8-oxo-dGTP diphosphatase